MMAGRMLGRTAAWGYRWGRLALPLLAVGGCVSDQVYRSFLVSQVENSLVDVFALMVQEFVASLFPNNATT